MKHTVRYKYLWFVAALQAVTLLAGSLEAKSSGDKYLASVSGDGGITYAEEPTAAEQDKKKRILTALMVEVDLELEQGLGVAPTNTGVSYLIWQAVQAGDPIWKRADVIAGLEAPSAERAWWASIRIEVETTADASASSTAELLLCLPGSTKKK